MKLMQIRFCFGVVLAVLCLLAFPGLSGVACAGTGTSALGNIMPLGDSITRGNDVLGGYRAPLSTLLTNWLSTCTFVGLATDNASTTLTAAGQTHHEGHGGYTISAGGTGNLYSNLVAWIGPTGAAPDRILLMIGSNDINLPYDKTNAPARLSALIDRIYFYRPSVKLYVASIIPNGLGKEADVLAYNATIPGIVASNQNIGRNVVYVPMHDALNSGTDLADGLHPNAVGYQKMAQVWNEALNTTTTGLVTTTTLNSSVNPSVYGQQVIFTATVRTNGVLAPDVTGNIVFSVDGVARAFVPVSGGSAAYTNSTLTTGARTIRGVYAGDGAYAASAASFTQTNNPGAASKLGFGQQPSATRPGFAISPAVTVLVQDADGNTETSDNSTMVTISGTDCSGDSTLTATAVGGVATFSNLKPMTLGDSIALTTSATSLVGSTSSPFHVGVVVTSGSYIPPRNTNTTVGVWDSYVISDGQSFIVGNWNTGGAILSQTGGVITFTGTWVGRMGIGSSDGPTWGEYNMSGNATFSATGLNGASSVYSYTITGYLGKSKLTMTDTATANIGSLTLKPFGGAPAIVVLSGSANLTVGKIGNNTDGYIIGAGCYIDFVSGSLATLTITGTHDFTNLVSAGSIRVDGIAQTNFSAFKIAGNTLSLAVVVPTYTITASADPVGGTITPSGSVQVPEGSSTNFVIAATNAHYYLTDVLVDLVSIGASNSYTFASVSTNHAIAVRFAAILTASPHPTPTGWLNQYYGVTNYAVVAEADSDGDGKAGWEEYLAGTDPANPQSVFKIIGLTKVGSTNVVVWLGGNTNLPPFEILVSTNLSTMAGGWTQLAVSIRSADGTNFWYDDVSATANLLRYYKIGATNAP